MKIFLVFVFSIFIQNELMAGNITDEVRRSYEERAKFIKN